MEYQMSPEEKIGKFRETYDALREEIGKVIVGQEAIVDGTLNALLLTAMCCSRAYQAWVKHCWSVL